MYKVKLEKFEGPMELLLELIEKEKMNITELSLSKVADEYLEYIKDNHNIHLENLAEFLSVAAKLILIKSKALLPMLKFSDEEEEEIKDLTYQLEEYKKFKKASLLIGEMAERGLISYARESFSGVKTVFYPPENINRFDLKKYFQLVISEIPQLEKLKEEVVEEVVTLEERIVELENSLRSKAETSFSTLIAKASTKVDAIISFLAMLEMIKQRIIKVEQKDLFEEIKLTVKRN